MSDPTDTRELAIQRLRARRGFTASLASYVIVNGFLWAIWALTGDQSLPPWPMWVTLGWGVGVAFQAWHVYGQRPITEADVQREMRRGQGPADPA